MKQATHIRISVVKECLTTAFNEKRTKNHFVHYHEMDGVVPEKYKTAANLLIT